MPPLPKATTALGRRILAAMDAAGITADALADKLDVTPGRVAQYLRAEWLRPETVGRIAAALGCDRATIDPELAPRLPDGTPTIAPVILEMVGFEAFATLMARCTKLERAIKAHRKATSADEASAADRKLWAAIDRPKSATARKKSGATP